MTAEDGQDHVPGAPEEEGAAVRLLQGYLWHPRDLAGEPGDWLPAELGEAHVLWDEVRPPFAFFENGEPTASQTFYQFTSLRVYDRRPDNETLHVHAQALTEALGPLLEATPAGVGWQLWEDLREL